MQPCLKVAVMFSGIVFALVATAEGLAAGVTAPVLELAYTATNILSVSAPNGNTFTAASATRVVPPGTYVVTIEDDAYDGTDPVHMFHLAGPGINLMTDLQGGDDKSEIYTETLAPNSTYTFKDDLAPSLPAIVFTTSATPAPPSSTPSPTTPIETTTGTTKSTSSTSANSDLVGSGKASTLFRGTLEGAVSARGALTLTRARRRVTTLKQGRYRIAVSDHSRTRGFFIEEFRRAAHALTGVSFVGRHATTLELGPGQWLLFSSLTGRKSYFIVMA
jgi:hypothetical protein